MFKSKEKDVFAKILSHTTIWDGGKKERSDSTIMCYRRIVTNFIQLVSSQLVDQFSQIKLCWKALNKGYLYIWDVQK